MTYLTTTLTLAALTCILIGSGLLLYHRALIISGVLSGFGIYGVLATSYTLAKACGL